MRTDKKKPGRRNSARVFKLNDYPLDVPDGKLLEKSDHFWNFISDVTGIERISGPLPRDDGLWKSSKGFHLCYSSTMRQILLSIVVALCGTAAARSESPVTRILFGSCLKQDKPVPIFETILPCEPEVFLFLGDNIYADTDDRELMRKKYAALGEMPGFIRLRETATVLATWTITITGSMMEVLISPPGKTRKRNSSISGRTRKTRKGEAGRESMARKSSGRKGSAFKSSCSTPATSEAPSKPVKNASAVPTIRTEILISPCWVRNSGPGSRRNCRSRPRFD